jgi:tetratricopeptide (TPR) repeat protein
MPEDPLPDPRRTGDGVTTRTGPLAVADRAGGVHLPAEVPNAAARYRLGQEMARGGMGVVYRATDMVLGREVAVKVLQDKYAPDSGTARRFANEARIMGQLQHPNIPAVHDLGVLPDGRPFLAMKLIKGNTLEDLLNRRTDPAAERGRYVAAFEQVCQAVAYAHAHAVIHRDLKPANVMVGAFGEVQVMDWGLAKVLGARPGERTDPEETTTVGTAVLSLRDSDDPYTRAGSVLGTPAFMPPEQAAGAVGLIDTRSDVFGLGAVLAVVLTGRPPFVSDTAESARVKAARADVGECWARLEACGADPGLVTLCRRCLAARPEDRPADAGAVAQAVAALRAAADERARRAEEEAREAKARAAEHRRRRQLLMGASAVVALVLLAGLGVSLWQMRRALWAESAANTNAQQAREERDAKAVALAAEQKARQDETKVREQAFGVLRSMTDDVVERKFAQSTVLTEDDRAFLRSVIARFDAFAAIKGDDTESRAVRAEGRFLVGRMRVRLGELTEAEKDFDQALAIQKQLVADFPSRPEFRQELARSHNNRGGLFYTLDRLKEAEEDFDQALTMQKRLVADFRTRPEFRQELARSHNNRGGLLYTMRRLGEAEKAYDQALAIQKQLAADLPARPEFRQELAASYSNRGLLLSETGRPQQAEQDFDQALSMYRQLVADLPTQPDLWNGLAGTCLNLALLHQQRGNWAAAKRLLLEGRPHHLAALKANPRHPTYRRFYRNHLGVLAEVHAELLEQQDAVRTAETCRDLGWDARGDAYDAACFLSQCILIVAQHDNLDAKQREEAAKFYGDAAMKLLREAVSKGYKDAPNMKRDSGLAPLRQREDFQKLVAELEGMGK